MHIESSFNGAIAKSSDSAIGPTLSHPKSPLWLREVSCGESCLNLFYEISLLPLLQEYESSTRILAALHKYAHLVDDAWC